MFRKTSLSHDAGTVHRWFGNQLSVLAISGIGGPIYLSSPRASSEFWAFAVIAELRGPCQEGWR